ncbi:globin domain-containing protein [Mobilicoccus pelagius]|uniref:nitric oxide dioxygenase n=1 Tax=Mobilicoccus pelagius NBRC 104925 TaxID=1089455 RepID=H5UUD9_9MICO|nr:globin domain-containing protein [Mobilicoccus pelagius]GAB49347.1 flavohemoprotein [Mobilicoccus pelagius NBRC 104925]
MLSAQSAEIVKATAGVVAENAVAITSRFYPEMFAAHPELLDVFNRADQALGDQPQALAASVVAYAVHLVDPGAPSFEPVLERIAHKHVSLGITAPQYTIVGHHLMQAIGEVLGDAVTPEVAMAWDEVYWLFALQLVAKEASLYTEKGVDPDHPWREMTVVERRDEVPDEVVTFTLRPVDGEPVPAHRAGQYVTVNAHLTDGSTQPRQYTVSSGPRPDTVQITVRRVRATGDAPAGVVSNHLLDECPVGSTLEVSVPCGDVVLDDDDAPLVLVSAGVGITPMAAILDDLAERRPSRRVILAHADRSAASHALYETTTATAAGLADVTTHLWYEEVADDGRGARPGFMDLSDLDVPAGAHVFMCGPLPFMRDARRTLIRKGVAPENIRYEVFGPDLWAQNPDAAETEAA